MSRGRSFIYANTLLRRLSDLPGNAARCLRTEHGAGPDSINVSLFGLAPQGVCPAEHVATLAGEPLPHRFTIAHASTANRASFRAVCSLLHSSVGSPRLAVSQPAVLWCSDFPPVTFRRSDSQPAITRSAPEFLRPKVSQRDAKYNAALSRTFSPGSLDKPFAASSRPPRPFHYSILTATRPTIF